MMGGGVSAERNQSQSNTPKVSPQTSSSTSQGRGFREIQLRHASDDGDVAASSSNPSQPGPSSPRKPKKMDPDWNEMTAPEPMERAKSDLSEFELPQYEVGSWSVVVLTFRGFAKLKKFQKSKKNWIELTPPTHPSSKLFFKTH